MENPAPPRHHRLVWLALATFAGLLLLPTTRYLLRMQMQMEALTYSTQTDLPAERAAAAHMPDDYPVQLALAAQYPPPTASPSPEGDSLARATSRNHRIDALTQRFPNNPSVYANFLRFMSQGEVHVGRNDDGSAPIAAAPVTTSQTAPESLEMFDTAAQRGAQLDPDNAYFPMMRAIGLFNAHRDNEALESLNIAGRCSHWTEYYQDEADGQNRLQSATYGERGAMQHLNNAAALLFPQYASLRAVARLAMHLAGEKEADGNTEEAVAIRHALMRCGGLMRAQGTSYITSLVGIAIVNIGTANPGGVQNHDSLNSGHATEEEAQKLREKRRELYYSYLESIGQGHEAAWARAEIAAADQAKALGSEAIHYSVFDGRHLFELGVSWLANIALFSSVLILLVLGSAAHLAASVRPKKALFVWRTAFALLILGGIGLWQWQAARIGMHPYVEIQNMFSSSSSGNGSDEQTNYTLSIQGLTIGLSLLTPALLVGLIAGLTLFQRVSLATGLGRGLRGVALSTAAVLFLIYGASLLVTARIESTIKSEMASVVRNEPQYFTEILHKAWPGDPQP